MFLKSAAKLDKIHNSNKNVGLKKLNSALIDIKILPGGKSFNRGVCHIIYQSLIQYKFWKLKRELILRMGVKFLRMGVKFLRMGVNELEARGRTDQLS